MATHQLLRAVNPRRPFITFKFWEFVEFEPDVKLDKYVKGHGILFSFLSSAHVSVGTCSAASDGGQRGPT